MALPASKASCEDCPLWAITVTRCTLRCLHADAGDLAVTGRLGRFSQLLEETEHFCGWCQEKVAKIVQCGEKIEEEAILADGLVFSPSSVMERLFLT